FPEPGSQRLPAGALRLTRLSSENLMVAWTGMAAGRHVVRAAAVGSSGVRPLVNVSPPGADALLADLAPGPRGEVLAVWTSPSARTGAAARILAARGYILRPLQARFGPPEQVAPAGPYGRPVAAFDPATDRAVAAWGVASAAPAVDYAVRAA